MSELSRKMFLAETAAVREHLAEQEQAATAKAEAALAPLEAKARELRARQRAEHRAAVLREAYEIAYAEGIRLNALEAEIGAGPYRGALAVAHLLRKAIADAQQPGRMADEAQP